MTPIVRVGGYQTALRLAAIGWPSHVITLLSGDVEAFKGPHLHVRMDDVVRPSLDFIQPRAEHLESILAWTESLDATARLLVHCLAGVNRSPPVAMAVLIQHGVPYAEAWRQIAAQVPSLAPNRLLLAYVDKRFDLGGKLRALATQ